MENRRAGPEIVEKRDSKLGLVARYSGGATVRLMDATGHVLRRMAVGEAPTRAEVDTALDYILALGLTPLQPRPGLL